MYQRPLLALLLASACSGGDDLPSSEPVDPTSTDTTPALDCSTRPTDIPTARGEMEGVWSPASQRMVFFGGDQGVPVNCSSQTDFVGDTWLWEDDCQNWRQVDGDAPNAMARYAAALDPVGDRMVVFGGRFRNGTEGDYTLRDKTWAFSFATETWTELDAGTGPSARAIHAGVVADGRFIVYGGTGSRSGTNYNPVYDETWAFNLTSNAWEQLPTTGGPGPPPSQSRSNVALAIMIQEPPDSDIRRRPPTRSTAGRSICILSFSLLSRSSPRRPPHLQAECTTVP